ncbi:MAG: uroporphyrinogen-III C-methyltransferase [Anaerolineae bacterium]|nr:uroporphyrinogen-III C-methyltransferase [Anaerolineae bacterium]
MTVYLIGAGPGDPGLITVRGQALLRVADVILYDRLISDELLLLAKSDALLINVGKNPHGRSVPQEQINDLLIEYGHQKPCVVRLKGGDPFVFGRGGEEMMACQQAGIPVEVVPGVSSAIGVPAYAGVPITHREVSRSFTVVTGHERDGQSTLNYAALAKLDTLVFLMGVKNLPDITSSLILHGRSPETPVVCIESGTYDHQRTVSGTLATITAMAADLKPPSIIVVGEVAGLGLTWKKSSPVAGDLILLARNDHDFLVHALTAYGAHVLRTGFEGSDSRLWNRSQVDKVILTSMDEGFAFANFVERYRIDVSSTDILCIGAGTADLLWAFGLTPALVVENNARLLALLEAQPMYKNFC